jgi:hypothetical protein
MTFSRHKDDINTKGHCKYDTWSQRRVANATPFNARLSRHRQSSVPGRSSRFESVALAPMNATDSIQRKRPSAGSPPSPDLAADAGCVSTSNAQVTPPTVQVTLTETQLGVIRQWILDGAPGPTP